MSDSCTPQPIVLDEDGYAHGPDVDIQMDNGGWYTIKGMTTPNGRGRHTSIHSRRGASQVVSTITLNSDSSCYVHWLDRSDPDNYSVMWHYEGIDADEVVWQFLMTLSLGSAANLIKRTADTSRYCEKN